MLVDGGWEEAAARRRGGALVRIGWAGCGVLDFGRRGDRWFLVLAAEARVPGRWRMLRRPAAADAARLALAFGRLAERVVGAGSRPTWPCSPTCAVGPGPTPFLERPLLQPPKGGTPVTGDGQRVLAGVCAAALGPLAPPPDLPAWLERARGGQLPGLADCLDELEPAASRTTPIRMRPGRPAWSVCSTRTSTSTA